MDSFDKLREVNKQLIEDIFNQSSTAVATTPWGDDLGRVNVPEAFADKIVIDAPEVDTKIRLLWLGRVQVLKAGEWVSPPQPSIDSARLREADKAAYKRECFWACLSHQALNAFCRQVDELCKLEHEQLHHEHYTFFRNLKRFMRFTMDIVGNTTTYKEADGRFVQHPGWGLADVPWVDVPFISTQRRDLKGKDVWMLRIYKDPRQPTVLYNGGDDPNDRVEVYVASSLHNYIELMSVSRWTDLICDHISGRVPVELSPTCELFVRASMEG